ncbi:MAG TPA: HD domain-containing protein [Amycolatopsis sp.]|uniref:HD domain-containing protein n=1 Tax=Amycolatopsis sp. TaxID=37632 RepID=UPI002B46561C|nr:HD domain-containing protein [Amycolatopsis sp.]HKS45084.1 HD domain-containing protein [Amycolatopsis sp.]
MDLVTWSTEVAGGKLADALPRRWAHVQGVRERARMAAPVFGSDGELLVAAGVLHDVGYAPELVDTGFHPIDGARYLRSLGAPERLVHLVAHHSCAAVEAELRGLSAELAEFEDEKTPLRDALWWADLTTTPDGGPTTIEDRVREITERYGAEHVVSRFVRRAWPELLGAVERTSDRVEASSGQG